jgi:hypothetical protein
LRLERAVYSDDDFISSGRWQIIGHDEALVALFPEPEIYHRPQPAISGVPPVGPHGSAETASGRLRDIDREEAEDVGLLDGTHHQVYPPEILEKSLDLLVGRTSAGS